MTPCSSLATRWNLALQLALVGVLRRASGRRLILDVATSSVGISLEGPSHKEGMKLRHRLIVCYELVRIHSVAGARVSW